MEKKRANKHSLSSLEGWEHESVSKFKLFFKEFLEAFEGSSETNLCLTNSKI